MTLRHAYQQGIERLRKAHVPEPELDAWYLLEFVTGIGRAAYYADSDKEMEAGQYERYDRYLSVRSERVPLQYITGTQEFMGLTFHVNRDVLIPRQDTEILVEEALDILKKKDVPRSDGSLRILDMCTGSGCILLSVLHYAGQEIQGVGSDFSAGALAAAQENARRLDIKAEFVESDLFERITGQYSMILSNPPYIKSAQIDGLQEEVRLFEPAEALDGQEDGLYFYRRIIKESAGYMQNGGYLMFEIGYDQADDVSDMMRRAGFSGVTVKRDLAGLDRVVYGRYSK